MKQRATNKPVVSKEMDKGVPMPTKSCYKHVAEPLPDNVTLNDIIDSLPKEVFEKSNVKAMFTITKTLVFVSLSMYLIHLSPWYLLPFAWAFAGTAVTGLFVIGHDCGHRSLFPSVLMNDIVGTLTLTLISYPYHPWRIKHNFHHANTNRLHVDNAWQPTNPEMFKDAGLATRVALNLVKGPLWWIGSIGHLVTEHFDMDSYTSKQQPAVRQSLYVLAIFMLTFFPAMYKLVGLWGIIKFYGVPWLGFHFWMSTFTLVHHTVPHIPFLGEDKWTMRDSRFTFTVHCDYPLWIEYLCHNINVHVPHHLNTTIANYNLKKAHRILKEKWGKYMHEADFGFELMYDIVTKCHLYHNKNYYQTFAYFWNNFTNDLDD